MKIYLVGRTEWFRAESGQSVPSYAPIAVFASRDEAGTWCRANIIGESFVTPMDLEIPMNERIVIVSRFPAVIQFIADQVAKSLHGQCHRNTVLRIEEDRVVFLETVAQTSMDGCDSFETGDDYGPPIETEWSVPLIRGDATPDDVRGKVVYGDDVPFHLACLASEVYAVEFNGAAPRGAEYTLAQMIAAGATLASYIVRKYDAAIERLMNIHAK